MLQAKPPTVDVNEKREAVTMLAQFTDSLAFLRVLRENNTEANLISIIQDGDARSEAKKAAVRALLIIHSASIMFGADGINCAV